MKDKEAVEADRAKAALAHDKLEELVRPGFHSISQLCFDAGCARLAIPWARVGRSRGAEGTDRTRLDSRMQPTEPRWDRHQGMVSFVQAILRLRAARFGSTTVTGVAISINSPVAREPHTCL